MSMSRMAPFDLSCKISDVSSEKLCYSTSFCEVHGRKNIIKMVVPEVVETRDVTRLNFVLSRDISQLKCLVCHKEVGML